MAAKNLPDAEYLRECLDYDPETGILTWKLRPLGHFDSKHLWRIWESSRAGNRAGTLTTHGYISVVLNRRSLYAHRIIWAMKTGAWPVAEIDHINRDRADNRFSNLRAVDRPANMRNRPHYRPKNANFPKGVFPYYGRFRATAWIDGRSAYLGTFDTVEDAHAAWKETQRAICGV